MPRSTRHPALLPVAAVLMAPAMATAASIEVEAGVGIGHSDNFARTEEDARSATLKSADLRFAVLEATRRLDADISGDLSLIDYNDDDFGTELTGNVTGRASLSLVEERLRWTVEDNFGQTRRDPFTAPTPENREQVNYFATGPDLRLRLGGPMSLLLGARYTRVDYEFSPADSMRAGAWIAAERELASGADLGLHITGERVEPRRESVEPSYDRSAAVLRYFIAGARTTAAIQIGANRVKGDEVKDTGALLRFELSRAVGRYSRLSLRAGQELTDAGASLSPPSAGSAFPGVGPGTASQLQTAQPYTNRYADFDWEITGRYTSIGLLAGWSDEDYEGAGQRDNKRQSLGLRVSRQLGARTQVSASATYNNNDFATAAGDDNDDIAYDAAWSMDIGRRLGVELSAERYQFSSSQAGADANETRFWLRLRYGDTFGRAPSR